MERAVFRVLPEAAGRRIAGHCYSEAVQAATVIRPLRLVRPALPVSVNYAIALASFTGVILATASHRDTSGQTQNLSPLIGEIGIL
jgi:hypothetical protein